MCKDKEWADHIVVIATAHLLQRDIVIVTSSPQGRDSAEPFIRISSDVNQSSEPLLLGHVWESHYQSLQRMSKLLFRKFKLGTLVNWGHLRCLYESKLGPSSTFFSNLGTQERRMTNPDFPNSRVHHFKVIKKINKKRLSQTEVRKSDTFPDFSTVFQTVNTTLRF